MMRATDLAHHFIRQVLRPGAVAVDATVGNGHDTVFLAELVGAAGRVYGFDIQASALTAAAARVAHLSQVELIGSGHEHLDARLPDGARHRLDAVMFNLGYLPGGDKEIVTHGATTLIALSQALDHLLVGGAVTVVLYPGHPAGAAEAADVRAFAAALPGVFAVAHFARLNSRQSAPELIVIERQRQ